MKVNYSRVKSSESQAPVAVKYANCPTPRDLLKLETG